MPATENITAETVIVRAMAPAGTQGTLVYLDRLTYLRGNRQSVNRAVRAYTQEVTDDFNALDAQTGDTLVVSTRYLYTGEGGEEGQVPDWKGNDYWEFPIAVHAVTSVARPAP